jgi:3-dehydroquinate synthase
MKTSHLIIGADLKKLMKKARPWVEGRTCFVIADRKIQTDKIVQSLNKISKSVAVINLVVSENVKSFTYMERLTTWLAVCGASRDSIVIAVGGGVIGDLAGFVAGIYMRGINWINIPTTLLSQVDSSLGGKTGINLPEGKNLVGLIHPPKAVICDVEFIESLSLRDQASGFGEIIKYALLFDLEFARELEPILKRRFKENKDLGSNEWIWIVSKCLQWKSKTVRKDLHEKKGIRELLNFGHTFAHALEKEQQFKLRHGEAVLIGMKMALELSRIRKHMDEKKAMKIQNLLDLVPVPQLSGMKFQNILKTMSRDKKVRNHRKRFVLLKSISKPLIDESVSDQEIQAAFAAVTLRGRRVSHRKRERTA